MSFEDEELLQDFLVEAGEILEKLQEQLVDLEQSPTDTDLLNAVFRGFHTIKGGASFLSLTSLVEVCHVAEDVFNLLRNGEKSVTAHLMDVMLRVLDSLNAMFESLHQRVEPDAADPELIVQLKALLKDDGSAETAQAPPVAPAPVVEQAPASKTPAPTPDGDFSDEEFAQLMNALDEDTASQASADAAAPPAAPESDEITEEEFDRLLDELHGQGQFKASGEAAVPSTSDDISEDEFESLLDDLHGKGKFGMVEGAPGEVAAAPAKPVSSEEISEDEFEDLLDELHGKGQFSGAHAEAVAAPAARSPAASSAVTAPPTKSAPAPTKPAESAAKPAAGKAAKDAAPQGESTVRVDTKRLDDIMNMVGELVLARNRLVTLQSTLNQGNEEFSQAIANLDLVTADLQTSVMKTRMQPIKKVFGRFPRVVRDLARSLKKEVNLELRGEDTDLDKNLVEALADPLVHLVRNAVDHGIEEPETRERNGKPRAGTVILSAEQEGDHILLTIQDDGAGMDPNRLRQKAVEKGLMDEEAAARMDNRDAYNLIFAPGFSTKDEISDISGRGVGMDVVKTRIVQLNGSVDIDSALGHGTRLSIKVPLTLAIMPTLMVMLGTQIFALPLVSVSEIFNLDLSNTNIVDGQKVIMLRNRPLPIYFLSDWLEKDGKLKAHPNNGHVVVVAIGDQRAGFVVETLVGQEEVVIKPLGAMLHGTKGLSGATITGDGRIALILDVPSLMKAYVRRA
ncbi:MAG: chemotaxis protein CheA [Gammaproteobacteria bacterium]|nr:chemotaxis protein CheA [Gammaproteobacteria bacterium]